MCDRVPNAPLKVLKKIWNSSLTVWFLWKKAVDSKVELILILKVLKQYSKCYHYKSTFYIASDRFRLTNVFIYLCRKWQLGPAPEKSSFCFVYHLVISLSHCKLLLFLIILFVTDFTVSLQWWSSCEEAKILLIKMCYFYDFKHFHTSLTVHRRALSVQVHELL